MKDMPGFRAKVAYSQTDFMVCSPPQAGLHRQGSSRLALVGVCPVGSGVMANGEKKKYGGADGRNERLQARVLPSVTRAEMSEYMFALLKSLAELTRGRAGMALATYLIEMAALEMAAVNGRDRRHGGADTRATI